MTDDRQGQVGVRAYQAGDLDAIVALSLRAWEPFFVHFAGEAGPALDRLLHPDWRAEQTGVVRAGCTGEGHLVAVAEVDGAVAGFAVVKLDHDERMGELHLLAVDPACQRRGAGDALNAWALDEMRTAGMRVAHVGTGGDPTHAAALRSYERAGYTPFATYHCFQVLDDPATES